MDTILTNYKYIKNLFRECYGFNGNQVTRFEADLVNYGALNL